MLRPSSIRSRSLVILTVLALALVALSLKTDRAFMMGREPAPVAPLFAGISVNTTVDENNLVISAFRENGPNGTGDEFVEILNAGTTTHTVTSMDGYGVFASAGNGTTSNEVSIVCHIPNGTKIPGGRYFLCTGTDYTLGNLGRNGGMAGTTAVGNAYIGCDGLISGCKSDIPNDAGLALLNVGSNTVTNTPAGLDAPFDPSPVGFAVFDKVGFEPYGASAPAPDRPPLASNFCEGTCLQPVGDASLLSTCTNPSGQFPVNAVALACYGQSGQYALLRRQTTWGPAQGTPPQNTNNNADDFILLSPNPGADTGRNVTGRSGVTAQLGAASPSNSNAPCDIPSTMLTRAPLFGVNQFGPGNVARSFSPDPFVADKANNPLGTFTLRYKYTNNSGTAISGLRFRIDNLATLCGAQTSTPTVGTGDARNVSTSPDCGTGSFTAIFKALNSFRETVEDSGGMPQLVNGTVLEDLSVTGASPPAPGALSPKGGGVNNALIVNPSAGSFSVGDGVNGGDGNFGTVIGAGAVLPAKFKFGVVRGGRFILLLGNEARQEAFATCP